MDLAAGNECLVAGFSRIRAAVGVKARGESGIRSGKVKAGTISIQRCKCASVHKQMLLFAFWGGMYHVRACTGEALPVAEGTSHVL